MEKAYRLISKFFTIGYRLQNIDMTIMLENEQRENTKISNFYWLQHVDTNFIHKLLILMSHKILFAVGRRLMD